MKWIFALFGFLLAARVLIDIDLWWHLRAGQFILETWQAIRFDPFSYTFFKQPWTSITWGYEVLLAAVFKIAGYSGLTLIHALVAAIASLASYLVFQELRRFNSFHNSEPGPDSHFSNLIFFFLSLPALYIVNFRWNQRPEMFSHAYLMLIAWALLRFNSQLLSLHSHLSWRELFKLPALWLILLLQVLWANTHGLFAIGWILTGSFLFTALLSPRAKNKSLWSLCQPWVFLLILQVLICLLNPRGLHGVLWVFHLFNILKHPLFRTAIPEASSPFTDLSWDTDTWALVLWSVLLSGSFLGFCYSKKLKWRDPRLLLALGPAFGFLYISVAGRRNIAIFMLWTLPFIANYLSEVLHPLAVRFWPSLVWKVLFRRSLIVLVPLVVLGLVSNVLRSGNPKTRFGFGMANFHYPEGVSRFIRENQLEQERFFTNIEMGDFLVAHNPQFKSYIDGRLAEVYSPKHFARMMEIMAHPKLIEEEAKRWNFKFIASTFSPPMMKSFLQELVAGKDWRILYVDTTGIILVKSEHFAQYAKADPEAHVSRLLEDAFLAVESERLELGKRWYNRLSWYWDQEQWWGTVALAESALILGRADLASRFLSRVDADGAQSKFYVSTLCLTNYFIVAQIGEKQGGVDPATVDEALTSCELAVKMDPREVATHQTYGLLLFNTNSPDQAIPYFERALELEGSNFQAHLMLARALFRVRERRSISIYREAARLRPHEAWILEEWGLAAQRMGEGADVDEAATKLEEMGQSAMAARVRSPAPQQ